MIKNNNTAVVKELEKRIEETSKRKVAVQLNGIMEHTLDSFIKCAPGMRLNTVEAIADGLGFDVEVNYVKRNGGN